MRALKSNRIKALLVSAILIFVLAFTESGIFAAPQGEAVSSLAQLKEAIDSGKSKVYLSADISTSGVIQIKDGKNITIDLNGHKITLDTQNTIRSGFRVYNSTLTICDSSADKSGEIIKGGNLGGFGGAVSLRDGSVFNLEGGTIKNCRAAYGGAVGVIGGSTFNMKGGIIEKNYSNGQYGRGAGVYVYDEDSTFNMTGGIIRGNLEYTAHHNPGAGVCVDEGATFNMKGGKIGDHLIVNGANSTSGNGAGVYVYNATFNLEGGTVENNYTTADGGGIYLDDGSVFNMTAPDALFYNQVTGDGAAIYVKNATVSISGTNIHDNKTGGSGGAVYFAETYSKTSTIKNTTITKNLCGYSGGAIYMGGVGGLQLENVKITDNVANTQSGGGIFTADKAILSMSGCTLSGNEADNGNYSNKKGYGGAIRLSNESQAILTNTTISDNTANEGGGIYIDDYAACTLTDVTIIANTADPNYYPNEYMTAGGIDSAGKLSLSGKVVIKDNVKNNLDIEPSDSNVLLHDEAYFDFIGDMTDGTSIGVWTLDENYMITSSYGNSSYDNWRKKPSRFFVSDIEPRTPQKNPHDSSDHEVYLLTPEHVHNLQGVAEVKATCQATGTKGHYKCSTCMRYYEDAQGDKELKLYELIIQKDMNNHVGPEKKGNEEITTEPGCTTKGVKSITYNCEKCNGVMRTATELIDPLGHDWEGPTVVDGRNKWKCSRCDAVIWGNKPECNHQIVEHASVDPTCTETGMGAYAECSVCNTLYKTGTTAETANEAENILTKEQYDALIIPALGHNESGWVTDENSVVEAGCVIDGHHDLYTYCMRCNVELNRKTVTDPKLGHNFGEPYMQNCLRMSLCGRCQGVEAVGPIHSLVEVPEVEPTCVSNGLKRSYVCTDCGKYLDYDWVSMYGDGPEVSYDSLVIPALGHTYGEWEMAEEPTADKEGIEIRTCTVCGAIEARDVDKVVYEFRKGANSKWKKNSGKSLDFTIKRSYKDEETYDVWFTGEVKTDDEDMDSSDFEASQGSVNLSIKPDYLDSLSAGKHKITVVFVDAEVSTEIEIVDSDKSSDDSGDSKEDDIKPADGTSVDTTGDGKADQKTPDNPSKGDLSKDNNKTTNLNTPKTADSSMIDISVISMITSAAMMGILIGIKRKRKGSH